MKFIFPANITSISFEGVQYDAGDDDMIEVEEHQHRLAAHVRELGFEQVVEKAPAPKKAAQAKKEDAAE